MSGKVREKATENAEDGSVKEGWTSVCTSTFEAELFVAADGSDESPGTAKKPLATLEGARNAIRRLKGTGGLVVWLRAGVHERSTTFALTAEDSGAENAPIVYRAHPGEEVRLVGGREIGDFKPVDDAAVLGRLRGKARGNVLQCDLKVRGVAELSEPFVAFDDVSCVPLAGMVLDLDRRVRRAVGGISPGVRVVLQKDLQGAGESRLPMGFLPIGQHDQLVVAGGPS